MTDDACRQAVAPAAGIRIGGHEITATITGGQGTNSLIITVFGEEEQPGYGCEHALELVDRAAVAAAFSAEHPPCLHLCHGVLDSGADLAEDRVEFTLPVQEFRSAEALEWPDPDAVDSDVAEVGASIACGHGFLKYCLDAGGLECVGIVPCAVHGNRADSGHVALDTAGIIDDGTNVWVGNENSVTEISARNGSLVRTLRVPVSANIHGWYTALVRAGAQLWAATPDTCRPYCISESDTGFYASFIEFNANDGSYVRAVSRNTTQAPIALASDGANVWVVGSYLHGGGTAGSVTELNASNGRQQWSASATIYYNPQATTYDSIAYADGRLWVANGESVTELDASDGKLIRVLSGAQYQFNGPAVIAAAGTHVL